MKFFLYVGAPGAGKTYLAKLIQARLGGLLIDDPRTIDEILRIPPDTKVVHITDPNFCLERVRKKVTISLEREFPGCRLIWLFFENNIEQCRANVIERDDGRKVEGSLRRFGKEYTWPTGQELLPCYNDEVDYNQLADYIVDEQIIAAQS